MNMMDYLLVIKVFLSSYKNIVLIFSLIKTASFYYFCFSLYKINDCEYNTEDYKSSKISIRAIVKNPEY